MEGDGLGVSAKREDLLGQLLELAPALVWLKDEAHRFLYMNNAFGAAFGINPDDWLGKSGWDLFPHEQASAMAENDSRVQETLAVKQVIEHVTHEGRDARDLSFKYPLPQPGGEVFLGGGTIDITDRVRAERALAASLAATEQASALRDVIIGVIAHDVKAPLRRLRLLLEGLDRKQPNFTPDLLMQMHRGPARSELRWGLSTDF